MSKNIVLFIDGTGNDGMSSSSDETTNVWKLYQLCQEADKC
jgi:uncharacterized protein (DUF2235 family)